MTAVSASRLARRPSDSRVWVMSVVAAGCVALVLRPVLSHYLRDPSVALVAMFTALLAAGACWPAPARSAGGRAVVSGLSTSVFVLVLGLAAFTVGRLIGGLPGVAAVSPRFVLMNTLAAVAEEAFFRRFLYGRLEAEGGPVLAVLGSTALFTIVHVTVYGAWALPIDAAAGLILGWQRWATGSWRIPAVTHVVANILMVV